MKYFICLLASCFIYSVSVDAKYKYPEGAKTTTERKIDRRISRYDTDKDGELTLEDYENYRRPRTRDERRIDRHDKRKGTYVSPEEAFKEMDTDGDGLISKEDMMRYESSHGNYF